MADYATLLRDHVTLACRSVDRIFLQAYVPKLQSVGGVCQFLYWQRGFGISSSAAFGKIGDAYVAEVYRWVKANAIPMRQPADHLRFAAAQTQGAHRQAAGTSPLPTHAAGPARCGAVHQGLRASPRTRLGRVRPKAPKGSRASQRTGERLAAT